MPGACDDDQRHTVGEAIGEPQRGPNDLVVQSWDTASKAGELNDYSVCSTWLIKDQDYFLLDLYRDRLTYPDLKRAIHRLADHYRPDSVLIEDKASGTALIQDLQNDPIASARRPIAIEPDSDKVTRASAQSAKIESGQVHLPNQALWLDDFRSELLQFPHGRFDDQVDSITQFLKWARDRNRRRLIIGEVII